MASTKEEQQWVKTVLDRTAKAKDAEEALRGLDDACWTSEATIARKVQTITRVWNSPGLVASVLELAGHPDRDVVYWACSLLGRFAFPPDLKLPFLHFPNMLPTLLRLLRTFDYENSLQFCLGAFSNVTLDLQAAAELRQCAELIEWCNAHLDDAEDKTRMWSTFILVNAADEATLLKLDFPFKNVDLIVGVLDASISGAKYLGATWGVVSPTRALRSLVVADKYRAYLFNKHDILAKLATVGEKTVNEFAENPMAPAALEHTLSIFTQFTFDAEPLKKMRSSEFLPRINALCAFGAAPEKPDAIRRGAEGLRFQLQGGQPASAATASASTSDKRKTSLTGGLRRLSFAGGATNKKKLVMISYQWSYQALAQQLEKEFIARGVDVWRDENEMKGDIIDAMADAVGKADFVVIVVSSSYKASANCKLECVLAHNSGRRLIPVLGEKGYVFKADGWLGAILGSLLYYDGTQLGQHLAGEVARIVRQELEGGHAKAATTLATNNAKAPNSPEEIRVWCAEKGLGKDVAESLIADGFTTAQDLKDLAASVVDFGCLKTHFAIPKNKVAVAFFLALRSL